MPEPPPEPEPPAEGLERRARRQSHDGRGHREGGEVPPGRSDHRDVSCSWGAVPWGFWSARSAWATEPWCRVRAARASSGPISASSVSRARLQLAAGLLERRPRGLLVRAAGLAQDADHASAQLGVGRDHVDHEVGPGPAQPHHDRRREPVEDELLGGAGLEPGGAGDHLRTGVDGEQHVDVSGQLGLRVGGHQQRQRPPLPGDSEGTGDVRRATGGGEADDDVATGRASQRRGPPARRRPRRSRPPRRGRRALRVVGDEQPGGGVEGGQQLGGVDERRAGPRCPAPK